MYSLAIQHEGIVSSWQDITAPADIRPKRTAGRRLHDQRPPLARSSGNYHITEHPIVTDRCYSNRFPLRISACLHMSCQVGFDFRACSGSIASAAVVSTARRRRATSDRATERANAPASVVATDRAIEQLGERPCE